MAVVGRALMTEPKLVLLDEPSMGLAPMLIHEIFNILTKLNSRKRSPSFWWNRTSSLP